jgi:hypothetical protein
MKVCQTSKILTVPDILKLFLSDDLYTSFKDEDD